MNLFPSEEDFIDLHTHNTDTQPHVYSILNLFLTDFPEIPSTRPLSIGMHPWHIIPESLEFTISTIKEAASLSNVVAIGETGLDKAIRTPLDLQIKIFNEHIHTAEEVKKPMIIHCVKANQELRAIKKSVNPSMPWILHGYHGSEQLTEELVLQGFYFSLNDWIKKNPAKGQMILSRIPVQNIFLETDEYQVPIYDLYQYTAEIMKIDIAGLKNSVNRNFHTAFHF